MKAKQLIKRVRERSNNLDFGPGSGISDDIILSYLNDAKTDIQSAIINEHPNLFNKEVVIDMVENQEAYNLPIDMNESGGIVRIERKLIGTQKWVPLVQAGPLERSLGYTGLPCQYIRSNNQILLRPIPSLNGPSTLRIVYKSDFNNLGLIRSSVIAETVDPLTNKIINITIDTSASSSTDPDVLDAWDMDEQSIEGTDYISLVDSEGRIVVGDIEVEDYSAGLITISSATWDSASAPTLIGLSVVTGYNASPKILDPQKPSRLIQSYLVDYAVKEVIASDSSTDVQEKILKLQQTEKRIVDSYSEFNEDFYPVPDIQGLY